MFVQKRGNDWLLLEWRSDDEPLRLVILGQFNTQDEALKAMAVEKAIAVVRQASLPADRSKAEKMFDEVWPLLADRGFGVKDCAC